MLNILVVEDEIYARQSLIKQIREYDEQGKFRIEEAENGEQALKIVLERMPDLIMTDIRMPKMDGLELLRRIRETDSQATVMMLSAYSDFAYVKQSLKNGACDYLLKPISDSELKECLDKFLHKNTTRRRETMITGQDAVTRFIRQKLEDDPEQDFVGNNMFRRIFKTYQILNMYFAGSGQFEPKKILEDIENVLEQEMWGGFRMFQRQRNVWTLVINADQDCHFFPRKLGKILERNACEFRIGVSRVHSGSDEIGIAFQEALDALACKLYLPDKILLYEQISKKEAEHFVLGQNEELMLRQALKNKSRKKTEEALAQIFRRLGEYPMVRMDSLSLFLKQILMILEEALHKGDDSIRFRQSSTNVLSFDSLADMEEYVTRIGTQICSMCEQSREEKSGDVIEQIISYVSQHYDQDITLKGLAENLLYMNSTYISHCFVERVGISFSAWLRNYRIREAKKMLENGSLSITEVASMSGYNDTSQFIRTFKQETGMTPKKYRDSIIK